MRKLITTGLIAVLAIVMGAATVQAQNPTSGTAGPLMWKYDTGTKTLTISGKGDMPNYTWKDKAPWQEHTREMQILVVEEGVTGIGDYAFQGAGNLISVTLPKTVTRIGDRSFVACESLPTISIPAGVIKIGPAAFGDCESLTSVTLPDGLKEIAHIAFTMCYELATVTIPSSVETIGTGAFSDCFNLSAITVAAGNANYVAVDGVLFNKAKTMLFQYPAGRADTSYVIPAEVTSIKEESFADAGRLTSVKFPAGLVSIENYAFAGCSALNAITIPAAVKTISRNAFSHMPSLTEITVEGANTAYASVEGVLFDKTKTRLLKYPQGRPATTYAIPTRVTTIDTFSFGDAKKLSSITLPASVTAIEGYAFYRCKSLKNITVGMKTPPDIDKKNVFEQVPVANVTLTVPKGSKAAYAAAPVWKEFKQISESTVGNVALPEVRIYAAGGRLYLTLQTAAPVGVYTLNGVLVRTFSAPAGETTVALPQGVYIVQVGDTAEKVFIN